MIFYNTLIDCYSKKIYNGPYKQENRKRPTHVNTAVSAYVISFSLYVSFQHVDSLPAIFSLDDLIFNLPLKIPGIFSPESFN